MRRKKKRLKKLKYEIIEQKAAIPVIIKFLSYPDAIKYLTSCHLINNLYTINHKILSEYHLLTFREHKSYVEAKALGQLNIHTMDTSAYLDLWAYPPSVVEKIKLIQLLPEDAKRRVLTRKSPANIMRFGIGVFCFLCASASSINIGYLFRSQNFSGYRSILLLIVALGCAVIAFGFALLIIIPTRTLQRNARRIHRSRVSLQHLQQFFPPEQQQISSLVDNNNDARITVMEDEDDDTDEKESKKETSSKGFESLTLALNNYWMPAFSTR